MKRSRAYEYPGDAEWNMPPSESTIQESDVLGPPLSSYISKVVCVILDAKNKLFALGDRKLLKYDSIMDKGIWLLKGFIIGAAMTAFMAFVLV